jgi:hypothetical protein
VYIAFFHQIERATYNGYTFSIQNYGKELVVTSGLDHINDSVIIDNNNITIQNETYQYHINDRKHNLISIEFLSNNIRLFDVNGFNTTLVKLHSSNKAIDHTSSSGSAGTPSTLEHTKNQELLISAIFVHLCIEEIFNGLNNFIIIHVFLFCIALLCYIMPAKIYKLLNKIFNIRNEQKSIAVIKKISIFLPVLYSLFIFILLI